MVELKPDLPPEPPREELARGQVVMNPNESQPYKVVFLIGDVAISEHPVSSVQEGEALIGEELPNVRVSARDKSRKAILATCREL